MDQLSPSTPRTIPSIRHTRTASEVRSPSRSRLTPHDDIFSDLSPARILEAFTTPSGRLKSSIESATPDDRAFGIRAAIASKRIEEWVEELQDWPWLADGGSAGFETPAGKRRKLSGDGPHSAHSKEDNGEPEYIGSLLASDVTEYEDRIDNIHIEMEELHVEEIKRQVLDTHFSPRSRPSSSASQAPPSFLASYTRMDDFTAIVTATVLKALPNLSRLMRLMEAWSVRLAVLQKVPTLLLQLDEAEVALQSGWAAIRVENPPSTGDEALSRESFEIMQNVLQRKVINLGRELDYLLDTLEGRVDTLPDVWLDRMEAIELDYGEWTVAGERKVRNGEWATMIQLRRQHEEEEKRIIHESQRIRAEKEVRNSKAEASRLITEQRSRDLAAIEPEASQEARDAQVEAEFEQLAVKNTAGEREIECQQIMPAAAEAESVHQKLDERVEIHEGMTTPPSHKGREEKDFVSEEVAMATDDIRAEDQNESAFESSRTEEHLLEPANVSRSPGESNDLQSHYGSDFYEKDVVALPVDEKQRANVIEPFDLAKSTFTDLATSDNLMSQPDNNATGASDLYDYQTTFTLKGARQQEAEAARNLAVQELDRETALLKYQKDAADTKFAQNYAKEVEVDLMKPIPARKAEEQARLGEVNYPTVFSMQERSRSAKNFKPDSEEETVVNGSFNRPVETYNIDGLEEPASGAHSPSVSELAQLATSECLNVTERGHNSSSFLSNLIELTPTPIAKQRLDGDVEIKGKPCDSSDHDDERSAFAPVANRTNENQDGRLDLGIYDGSHLTEVLLKAEDDFNINKTDSQDCSNDTVNNRSESKTALFVTASPSSVQKLNCQDSSDDQGIIDRVYYPDPPLNGIPPFLDGHVSDDWPFGRPQADVHVMSQAGLSLPVTGGGSLSETAPDIQAPFVLHASSVLEGNDDTNTSFDLHSWESEPHAGASLTALQVRTETANLGHGRGPSISSDYSISSPSPEILEAEPAEYFQPKFSTLKASDPPFLSDEPKTPQSPIKTIELSNRLPISSGTQDLYPGASGIDGRDLSSEPGAPFDVEDFRATGDGATESTQRDTQLDDIHPTVLARKTSIIRLNSGPKQISIPSRDTVSAGASTVITKKPAEEPSSPASPIIPYSPCGLSTPVSVRSRTNSLRESEDLSPSIRRHRNGTSHDYSSPDSPPPIPDLSSQRLSNHPRNLSFSSTVSGDTPLFESVDVTTAPLKSPRKGGSSDDQMQQQISHLLESIPARILLTSEPDVSPPEKLVVKKTRPVGPALRSSSSMSTYSRAPTPSFTLAPAYGKGPSRHRPQNSNPEIKLYHLSRSTGEAPIKLFVRLVGERGERVMVRVGGGWADLGEYLKEYASHHGRRAAVTDDGKVEIQDLTPRIVSSSSTTSTATIRGNNNGRSSPLPSRPGSAFDRPMSSLAIRKTRKSTGMSDIPEPNKHSIRSPSTPLPSSFHSRPRLETPSSASSTNSTSYDRSSSRLSWNEEEDQSLGLAGPKSKKTTISERDQEWVESMKEKVRLASAEKEKARQRGTSFGELDKVGGTKRLFKRT